MTHRIINNEVPLIQDLSHRLHFVTRSWRKTIDQSGLPGDVQELIRTVVKKSRLLRFEKVEVVQELIAHFQDGRLAGKSDQQMIANFGDPIITAKLIHRSKIRNRPIMFKIAQLFGLFSLALISVYLMILSYFHMGHPQPTSDFLADLNRSSLEGDEHEKAWPIYRPVWIKHGFSEGGGIDLKELFHKEGDNRQRRLARPGDPEWQGAVNKLDELEELLNVFRQYSHLPRLGLELQADISKYSAEDLKALFPNRDFAQEQASRQNQDVNKYEDAEGLVDRSIICILLPHIQSFRRAARCFHVDTRWAVQQNDPERVVQNIEAILGLAHQASDSNILVCGLVGTAVAFMAFDVIEEVVVEEPGFLNEQQLARLQTKLERLSIRGWYGLEGERAMMHDILQRIYTDDGNGDGRITPVGATLVNRYLTGLVANRVELDSGYPEIMLVTPIAKKIAEPLSLFVFAGRKETTEVYDKFIDAYAADLDTPAWEAVSTAAEVDEFFENNPTRFRVVQMMLPAVGKIRRTMIRAEGRKEGVIAALAFNRYRLKFNEWPESIDQVAPEFVTEFPVDQMNGGFVNVHPDEHGLLIYSVGNDRKDDSGQKFGAPDDFQRHPNTFIDDEGFSADEGDWILWPQSRFPDDNKQ